MKKSIITLILLFFSSLLFAQNYTSQSITNNAFYFSSTWGDLQMRRHVVGDLVWKRALVPDDNSILSINHAGDFTGGTRIGGDKLMILGNVGIGLSNPTEKLEVNGTIHAKEVRVDLTGWPDYVFEKGYKLPSLKEVEKHIKENGHLENIPAAEEVEKEGIKLGEMNAKLLQKIEELTLYILQQDKRIKELEDIYKASDK